MQNGDRLHLTDGKGKLITAIITNNHKKHCETKIQSVQEKPKPKPQVTIAIALTKNTNRFEWFLEKAAELGISTIIPIITKRTERQKFKSERYKNILISALLQSQQAWLLQLQTPTTFDTLLQTVSVAAIPN